MKSTDWKVVAEIDALQREWEVLDPIQKGERLAVLILVEEEPGTELNRHSYRMWIDAIGTPIGVRQKLMRHSDIRTSMNIYGDAESGDMRRVNGKIAELVLSLQ